jgi:Domain of unknown function (DUF4062)
MTTTSRTFRIFVSSTFSDLVVERNALQEHVFPCLRAMSRLGDTYVTITPRTHASEEIGLCMKPRTGRCAWRCWAASGGATAG